MSEVVVVETRLNEISATIKQHLKRQWEDVLTIGGLALEAKSLIPHGGFTDWITDELGLSPRLIQGYMRVYERFETRKVFVNLPISALLLLASPSVPDGLVMEVSSRIEQGERFTVEGIDNLIDRYRGLEGAKIGSHLLLKNFGTNPDGSLARSISRSALTSLEQVADEGLGRGALTLNGEDHSVNVTLPQTVMLVTQQETKRRQSEHIDDNTPTKVYSDAVVCEVANDDELRQMGYVTIRVLNHEAFEQLSNGQTMTIRFEAKDKQDA